MPHIFYGSDALSRVRQAVPPVQRSDNTLHEAKRRPPPSFRTVSGLGLMNNPLYLSEGATNITDSCPHRMADSTSSPRSPFPHKPVTKRAGKGRLRGVVLAAHSVLRDGKRFLKPIPSMCVMSPCFVEMRRPIQVDNYITRTRRLALRRLLTYKRYRAISDSLEGLTLHQSQRLTRQRLERKFTVIMRPLRKGAPRLSWHEIKQTINKSVQRERTWFPFVVARLFKTWLIRQYIAKDDMGPPEYWFEDPSYKKRCCKAKT